MDNRLFFGILAIYGDRYYYVVGSRDALVLTNRGVRPGFKMDDLQLTSTLSHEAVSRGLLFFATYCALFTDLYTR